ncbi:MULTISPECIES: LysM domain-containing protein [unclassified Actinomyces]|uniref:LysM peptidoglycan-binding domain-containing protein n=1 Tax=unclassified Actinomyces TaxID=2609248 RepID=UPI002017E6E8|nr:MULTISPECIES: LysM domain-containing protein [unclassified Actinomyces]MCL3778644.1 LysM peptidoglycan-binding domain-containing protein [Actinomyces sp. AC-20-1]MCL3790565.1 LysM peptidoglycan-binding domain-containing protein [Actinomyces sp. 187325]MCL3792890.1 LysM peptidoglycan-binding domain-containing protein [Actinomyces sp. 186855]MCL3795284.1 LysM peptidoglycan-binding domain-containing protein [Actinomyces sp. 217892]
MSTTTRLGLVTVLSALVAAALVSSAAAATRSLLALPPHLWGAGHVDELLVVLLGSAGTAGALWYALSGVLALAALGPRTRCRSAGSAARLLSRWGAPYVRRVAAGALATALVLPGTAVAQEVPPLPDDLGWAPTVSATAEPGDTATPPATGPGGAAARDNAPGPSTGPTAMPTETLAATSTATPTTMSTAASEAAPSEAPAAGTIPETASGAATEESPAYVVQDGDSLWTITSSLLHRATPSEVAVAWPELYHANDDVIGADPDLIHPGTVLALPTALTDRT